MPVVKKPKRKYQQGGRVVEQERMENILNPTRPAGYTAEENEEMDELIRKYNGMEDTLDPTRPKGYTAKERKDMDELIRKYNGKKAIPPKVKPKDEMMKPKQSKARGGLIKGASDFQGTSGYSKIESFEGHGSAKATKKKVKK